MFSERKASSGYSTVSKTLTALCRNVKRSYRLFSIFRIFSRFTEAKTDTPLPTFKSDFNTKAALAICTAGVALFGICSCIYEWIAAAGL